MSWENAVGLIISVVVLVYLAYALLAPERLG
jgi:K+-transporting ATPase KdpF subunit